MKTNAPITKPAGENTNRNLPARTWVEVNLDNIAHNYHEFCRLSGTRVMCVIKADGYGHGAVRLARRLVSEGCDAFGVATLDEGIELRRAGITEFVLLLNHVSESRIDIALENNLTMTVYSFEMAQKINDRVELLNQRLSGAEVEGAQTEDSATNSLKDSINDFTKDSIRNSTEVATGLAEAAERKAAKKIKARVHLKFDTGMTRVGFNPGEKEAAVHAVEAFNFIKNLTNIEIEGVFTHFSSADERGTNFTNGQIATLNRVFESAKQAGVDIKIRHAANSAATIMYSDARLDMVRVGISLYGCYPSRYVDKSRVELKPAMQLKTQIFRINEVVEGTAVSYGRKFVAQRRTRLATLPIGYADGLSRVMAGKLKVLINGQLAPVVGKICMDQCVVDITDIIGEVRVLDEVVIYGSQGEAFQSVDTVAKCMGTINYEILCMTARRVTRFYYEDGKASDSTNFLLTIPAMANINNSGKQ